MAASHRKTDTRQRYWNIAKGHKCTRAVQQLASLLDHLISECQKIYRQLDASGLCGLEVDDELVMCRLLKRQISRPRATQDACGETGRAFHAFFQVGSIGHQAAVMHIGDIVFVEGWNMVRAGVFEHALAVEGRERVRDHEDGIRWVAIHGFEYSDKIIGLAHTECLHRYSKRPRGVGGGIITHAHAEIVSVPQHRDPSHLRHRLLDQLETFGGESRSVVRNAGDVAARVRKAVDKARRDRIAGSKEDHRRHIRDLTGERGWKAAGDDHIRSISLHAPDNLAKLTDLTTRSACLVREVFAECIAMLLQLFQQDRPERRFLVYRRTRKERTDTVNLRWALSDRIAGVGDQRAGEKRNEVATEHGILLKPHRLTVQILSLVPFGRKDRNPSRLLNAPL